MGSENENIFRHIKNAVIYSWAGLKAAWDNEMAFRTEVIVIALIMPIGIWIGETAVQWALLIGSAMLVLITELLNSAVENVVDRIGREHHLLSKQAKDLGSAAAAVSMLTAVIVWGLIAYERFLA
ncbi:MAG: diacylglycerol kinase [Desulfobacterales bacterium]|nr:diacylglycerol kinase [Desulfobacterales bacterium]MDH3877389.1 diacylglycerol kinase [Desulfobacterales bacterium]